MTIIFSWVLCSLFSLLTEKSACELGGPSAQECSFCVSLVVLTKTSAWSKAKELCSGVVNEFSLRSYLVTFVHDLIVCDYVNVACA